MLIFFFSWNSLAFLYDSIDVGNFISGFSDFYKPRLYIWKFLVHILLRYSLKDFEHYFASIRNDCNFMEFELCTIWRYLCQIDCYFLFICLVLCFFFFYHVFSSAACFLVFSFCLIYYIWSLLSLAWKVIILLICGVCSQWMGLDQYLLKVSWWGEWCLCFLVWSCF